MSNEHREVTVGTSMDYAEATLRRGGVVAFPTETYYGIAVDPFNQAAVSRVYRLKKRDQSKPLMLLIADEAQLGGLVRTVPSLYGPLIKKYWPGPLTLIFQAKASVSHLVTCNSGTVAIRISSHPLALALVARMGQPITATSANISGQPPAKSAGEVTAMFGDSLDYILDGGETPAGLCSTIVGMKGRNLNLVRQGEIDLFIGSDGDRGGPGNADAAATEGDEGGEKQGLNRLKWDRGYALEQAGEDCELVAELLEIFKSSLRNDLQLMAKGLAEGSSVTVYRAAHSIKGGAASLGIAAIAELALDIEQQCHAGSLELARGKLPLLETLLAELQNA